ncbi:hypothetical protein NL676_009911 [Syzygium grande]|nr:hypothetical protein NL676_009911 [Syzygium grande]
MLKRCVSAHHRFFSSRRVITTCALQLEAPACATAGNSADHKSLTLSLLEQLIWWGQISSAQSVVRRIITHSLSALDAVSAVDYLASRGLDLDLNSHGAHFCRNLCSVVSTNWLRRGIMRTLSAEALILILIRRSPFGYLQENKMVLLWENLLEVERRNLFLHFSTCDRHGCAAFDYLIIMIWLYAI